MLILTLVMIGAILASLMPSDAGPVKILRILAKILLFLAAGVVVLGLLLLGLCIRG